MDRVLQGLRPYTPSDIEKLAHLLSEAQAWPPPGKPAPQDIIARWAQRSVAPEEAVNVLPGAGGELIAYSQAALFKDGTPRLSFEIAVCPGYRKQGIGSALYRLVEHRANEIGVTHMSSRLFCTLGQARPESSDFLEHRGFGLDSSYWQMRIDNIQGVGMPCWPTGISFRTFKDITSDSERWAQLVREEFREPASPATVRAQLAEAGVDQSGYFFAIDDETGVEIGTSRARIDSHAGVPVGYLGTVGVLQEYRGRGIARALVLQTLHYLAQQGVRSATLYVEHRNHAARALYDRMGWYPVYRTDNYWKRILPFAAQQTA